MTEPARIWREYDEAAPLEGAASELFPHGTPS